MDVIQKQFNPDDAVDLAIEASLRSGENLLRTKMSASLVATEEIQKDWDSEDVIEKEW